jgi:hypothetical protein
MAHRLKKFPQQLGDITRALTKPILSKQGFLNGSILQDWRLIVGDSYGDAISPEKITFPRGKNSGGTLHVSVANGGMALLFEHKKIQVLERINTYYGYEALSSVHIRLSHQSFERPLSRKLPPLSIQDKALIEDQLEDVTDVALKQVLADLGCAIMQDEKNK